MAHLDRYTPEICSQLAQIARRRNWRAWDKSIQSEELLEDLELTYHLHAAAEATGVRAGLPAMPEFPIGFIDSEGVLDPAKFVRSFCARYDLASGWNLSDNGSHTALTASA
jgi:hypothetical protein